MTQCSATAKSTGEQCERAAIKGGTVCYVHGGNAPQTKAKAQERLDAMADTATAELQNRLQGVFDRMDHAEGKEYVSLLREARQLTTSIRDRTGHGPTEKREVTGPDGDSLSVTLTREVVDADS